MSYAAANEEKMYTVTVNFYTTTNLESEFSDIDGIKRYVATLVTETNAGYNKSGINLKVKPFCVQSSGIDERMYNHITILSKFRQIRGTGESTSI